MEIASKFFLFSFLLFVFVFDESKCESEPQQQQQHKQQQQSSLPPSKLDSVKDEIVAYHNEKRSQVSPPATNMKTMQWDDNLARLAQKWSEGCEWGHGSPPETKDTIGPDGKKIGDQYPWKGLGNLGQNLAIGEGGYNWRNAIDSWYNEVDNYDYCKNVKKDPNKKPNPAVGHYTAVVWENSTHVGCGKMKCSRTVNSDMINANYITCNYWPAGNVHDFDFGRVGRPYRTKPECVCDAEACSGEGKKRNKTEKNLDGDSPNNANTFNIVFVAAVAVASTLVNLHQHV